MNTHARKFEPDFGPLLKLTEDLADPRDGRIEPRLGVAVAGEATDAPDDDLDLDFDDEEDDAPPARSRRPVRRQGAAVDTVLGAWGGFWRAMVIGVVSGTVGGVVGALTLVYMTGAGWGTFARLLIDAIGRL